MRATAPTLRRRNFARAEATRAWVEATKRQVLDNTSDDDSLSDANSLNSLSDDNSLNSLSDDNSLSDSDAGQQQPPQTTNPPQLTGAAKTRQRLTAGQRAQRLQARQNLLDPNTSDDNSVDSLSDGNSLDSLNSADSASSADEAARPLPASTRRPLSSKTRARLAAKHRRALEARRALDSDSADSANDSLDSGDESSADEARPLRRPTRTQKKRATRRSLEARQPQNLLDPNTSADDSLSENNSVDSLSDNNSLDSLSDGNSLGSASDSDAARPLPANPPNLTSKGPKRLGSGPRPARISATPRISKREILGKHANLVAEAEAAAESAVPTIALPDLVNAPLDPAEEEEGEEDDADSVSSLSSDSEDEDEEEEEEEEEEETAAPTGTQQPSATAAGSTTVDGGATTTVTSGPEDVLAPVQSGDAALPNLTLAPEATASPSGVLGAINGDAQADTQGQQTLVPVPQKMNTGATVGIVLGILGFIALLSGFAFLFMKWRRRRQSPSSSSSPPPFSFYTADEKAMPPGGNVPPITFTHPSWPNNRNSQAQQRAMDPKTNSEVINDMMRAAYAAEAGAGGNVMANHADHYIDEKAYAMLAGHPPTPSVAGTEKRSVSKWLGDVQTPATAAPTPPRQSAMSQKWPYPVDPPVAAQGPLPVGMPGYGNTRSTTKQKRLTPPRLPLKPVVPSSLRPGGGAVGGTGLPPGSNVNPRMTVVTATTDTTSSSARWG